MKIIKIVMSYLLGLALVHLIMIPGTAGQLIPMILAMGFQLDEAMSVLIHIYVVGGLVSYLFYYLFTHKTISKLFLCCWLLIGVIICFFYTFDICHIIYIFMYNHFMKSVHDAYYSVYRYQTAFSMILIYILCQLSAILLYFMARLSLRIWTAIRKVKKPDL